MTKTTTNPIDALGAFIAETTMVAAAEIVRARGLTADVDVLVAAIRAHAAAAGRRILDDGQVLAIGGHAGWLDALVNAECVCAANAAVDDMVTAAQLTLDAAE